MKTNNLYVPKAEHVLHRRHTTVDQVHSLMLAAIAGGELTAGQELRDQAWATELKVSRTPIREAIKRLEAHGIVDIAAARYTRLASFTPDTARREARDWAAIHRSLLSEICENADRALVQSLQRAQKRHRTAREPRVYTAGLAFFDHIRARSNSFSVQLGSVAVAYRLRLALPNLPDLREADEELLVDIIEAFKRRDADELQPCFVRWLQASQDSESSALSA